MPDTILPPAAIQSRGGGGSIKVKSKDADYYAMKAYSVTVFNDTFKERYFFTEYPAHRCSMMEQLESLAWMRCKTMICCLIL
jgi:hypothetical protein